MFTKQHGQRSSSWKQPGALRKLQSWGGPGFKGFVVTARWGQGRLCPGPQETPEDRRLGPPAALSGGAGRGGGGQAAFSSGLGGIQGSGPEVRWESTAILGQSSCSLSSSVPSSLPRKIPARKLGVCGGLGAYRGCGSLPATPLPHPPEPQPRFPSHHPARGSW